jgi:hypothetical protein
MGIEASMPKDISRSRVMAFVPDKCTPYVSVDLTCDKFAALKTDLPSQIRKEETQCRKDRRVHYRSSREGTRYQVLKLDCLATYRTWMMHDKKT